MRASLAASSSGSGGRPHLRTRKSLIVTSVRKTKSWIVTNTLFTILWNLSYKKVKKPKIFPLPFYVFVGPGSGVHDPRYGIRESKNQDSGSGINIPDSQHCLSEVEDCWGPSASITGQSYHSSSITSQRLTPVEVPQPPLLASPTTPHPLPLKGWRFLRFLSLHCWHDFHILLPYLSTFHRLTPVQVPQLPLPRLSITR